MFAEALTRRGHQVTWVAHPDDLGDALAHGPFDVCLTELNFRQLSELTAVARMRQHLPDARLVVLSRTHQRAVADAVLAAGAAAVVPKTAPIEFALQAIEGARTGMVASTTPGPADNADALVEEPTFLTPREHQVLAGLANGHGTEHIADQLGVAHTTARTYIQNILTKLGVHSKVQAVAVAFALDLVTPGEVFGAPTATAEPAPQGMR